MDPPAEPLGTTKFECHLCVFVFIFDDYEWYLSCVIWLLIGSSPTFSIQPLLLDVLGVCAFLETFAPQVLRQTTNGGKHNRNLSRHQNQNWR